jgi:hypothetical protein
MVYPSALSAVGLRFTPIIGAGEEIGFDSTSISGKGKSGLEPVRDCTCVSRTLWN